MVENFAAFKNGTVLVSGFYLPSATPQSSGKLSTKAVLMMFDESGKAIRQTEGLADTDIANTLKNVHEGGSTVAQDGDLYLLHGTEVLVMSQRGDILRHIKYPKPEEYAPIKICVSQGLIAVWLVKNGKDGTVVPEYMILDLSTGELRGVYIPEDDLGNTAISFSREDGFTFIKHENGKIKLLIAPLR